jgi:hypothetical protein
MRHLGWILALPLVFAVGGAAEAGDILSLFHGGPNQSSDEDREYLVDRTFATPGAPGAGVVGQIDIGDSLRGHLNMNTLNSASGNVGGITGNNEWTGVFQLLVTGKVCAAGTCTFTFAPDPAFAADIGGGQVVTGVPGGTGALVAFFEGSGATLNYAGDFNDPAPGTPPAGPDDGAAPQTVPPSSADVSVGPYATEEAFIALAMDGTRFWTLGFTGPIVAGIVTPAFGEGWTATSIIGDNVLGGFFVTQGTQTVGFNAGLNRLVNGIAETGDAVTLGTVPTIFPIGLGLANFAISGQSKGVFDLDTPFEASSNFNMSFNQVILTPEPGALLLMGMGLLGLAGMRRMRRSRS